MLTSTPRRQEFSHPGSAYAVCLLLLGGTAAGCESTHGGTTTNDASVVPADASEDDASEDASEDDADVELDAGTDAEAEDTSTPQPMPEIEEGQPCETDAQCDDHIYCNGAERCVQPDENSDPVCQPALRLPCSTEHPCREALEDCECGDKDLDNDNYAARECGGEDCNDRRIDCFPGATEVCDRDDEDEDCNPTTYNNQSGGKSLDGDDDNDGRIDDQCRNQDPETGEWHGGIDCDDHNPSIHRQASEVCDYHDNNCNGFVDEKLNEDGTSEEVNGGLMVTFGPDLDEDLYADREGEAIRACDFYQPPGYVLATRGLDCDDENRRTNPDALERCDGFDNDCDGLVDVDDSELRHEYDFVETTVLCEEGHWIIPEDGCLDKDRLWCPERGDPIDQGCRTDATRLTSCRTCRTDCAFSCGATGCDDIVGLALGTEHSCGITQEGRITCWGRGTLGQLGNDGTRNAATPELVVGIGNVAEAAAGSEHTCAIAGEERALYCWGSNGSGRLGTNDVADESLTAVPVPVVGLNSTRLTGVRQVGAGSAQTCAVLDTGELVCFGETASGRLANGNASITSGRQIPAVGQRLAYNPILKLTLATHVTNARTVVVGDAHGCITTATGTVECWGDNRDGQLGNGNAPTPLGYVTPVPGLTDVTMLAAAGNHTCALKSGQVYCWGLNDVLQLGRAHGEDEAIPKLVPGLVDAIAISAGTTFTCALRQTGSTVCWGANGAHQLGAIEVTQSAVPVIIPSVQNTTKLALGGQHACSLQGSKVFCWGSNAYGQIGTGVTTLAPQQVPEQIKALFGSKH